MRFHPRLAPIKAAVFPLVAKDNMPETAAPIFEEIKRHVPAQFDAKQSIGNRPSAYMSGSPLMRDISCALVILVVMRSPVSASARVHATARLS